MNNISILVMNLISTMFGYSTHGKIRIKQENHLLMNDVAYIRRILVCMYIIVYLFDYHVTIQSLIDSLTLHSGFPGENSTIW